MYVYGCVWVYVWIYIYGYVHGYRVSILREAWFNKYRGLPPLGAHFHHHWDLLLHEVHFYHHWVFGSSLPQCTMGFACATFLGHLCISRFPGRARVSGPVLNRRAWFSALELPR